MKRIVCSSGSLAARLTLAVLASVTAVTGCGGSGAYIWANEAPDALFSSPPNLIIRSDDTISIRVFGQEALSVRMKVRTDGVITMPLIGNVVAAGKGTDAIAREIEQRLQPFVNGANVVVIDEESNVRVVAVGEIHRAGTIVLDSGDTRLLTAIANAGGLTEFASQSGIYVLRTDATGSYRIRFDYDDIVRGTGKSAIFRLRDGDQVIVE